MTDCYRHGIECANELGAPVIFLTADIILAVDEPIHAVRCTPGAPTGCRIDRSRCLTHDLWEELSNQIHLYLSSVSLGDVCERRILGTSGLVQRENYRTAKAS